MTYIEPTNLTSLVGLFQYANTVTNDVFVVMLLITIYLVPLIYLILKNPDNFLSSAMAAGFIVSISAILLRTAEITIYDRYVFIAIATLILPIVVTMFRDK